MVSKCEVASYDFEMKSWLSVPSSFGLKTSLIYNLFVISWRFEITFYLNLKELLFDWPQKVKAWLNFSFWVVRLHIGGYHCNKPTFRCNLVEYLEHQSNDLSVSPSNLIGCGDHGHVNVRLSSNLFLWDDDLS